VVSAKPFRKESAVITKDSGGYSPRTSDTQWLNVHNVIVAKRGTTVNSVTVVVDQIVAPVPGGIGRYALNLIRALSERDTNPQKLIGYVPRVSHDTVRQLEGLLPLLHGFEMSPLQRGLLGRAWRYGFAVPRRELTYSPSLFAPLTEFGTHIVTIHDAVPWTHPETLTPNGVVWHRAMARRAERFADVIVVPTEAVAARLSTYLNLGDRIRVIGGAPSADLVVPADSAARRAALGVPDRYVTFVGTLEPRKGLEQLLKSLASMDDLPLVLIGPMGWGGVDVPTLVARTGIHPSRVIALGRLDDADLVSVLAGSRGLVVPSLDEGFGLPVLEAMTLGTPVIHSTAEALLEVAGGAAIAVDVHGVNGTIALAEALTGLDDETLRRDLASRGRARAAAFSWDSSAAALGAIIDELS
jgi:glycosyltransferase involved in cell wall biosynthesis